MWRENRRGEIRRESQNDRESRSLKNYGGRIARRFSWIPPVIRRVCWIGLATIGVLPASSRAAGADGRNELFPAFPTAEGAGAYTPGGRGGKVLLVTNLQDYDPRSQRPIAGSLRKAVMTKGRRIIVFESAARSS